MRSTNLIYLTLLLALAGSAGMPMADAHAQASARAAGKSSVAALSISEARFAADLRTAATQPGGVLLFVPHPELTPSFSHQATPGADDCAHTATLSATSRAQARRLGAIIRSAGSRPSQVAAASLCSARETARLAFGDYEEWGALDQSTGASDELRGAELAGYLRAQADTAQAGHARSIVALVASPQSLSDAARKFGVELPPNEVVGVVSRAGRLVVQLRWRWSEGDGDVISPVAKPGKRAPVNPLPANTVKKRAG